MPQYMHGSGGSWRQHPVEVEHRLTALEMTSEDHEGRLTDLETPPHSAWAPRDYMMAGAGVSMVLAALTEKVGWTTVLSGLVKLYGVK